MARFFSEFLLLFAVGLLVACCTLTAISFVTLRLFFIGWKYQSYSVYIMPKSMINCTKMFIQKIWKSDTTTFFLDLGELVYVFSISDKQTTSNCSANLNTKLINENRCPSFKRLSIHDRAKLKSAPNEIVHQKQQIFQS